MISHAHQTLFVHVPKTAGQSIERVFLDDLGLTWQERAVLMLRHNDDLGAGPEKLAHLYAEEYVRLGYVAAETFARYLKFAVVRHPYDRFLSEYRYRAGARSRRGLAVPDLDAFLAKAPSEDGSDLGRHLVPQVRFIEDAAGRCLVDHVLRFEDLAAQIAPVFLRVFGAARTLPHKNRSPRRGGLTLNAAQKAVLADRYRADFEAFGYDV